jgi:5-methylphenazine-1-carboxylate 1-monooxygenase
MEIIIIGGGIGGLTTALALHASGVTGRVRVFEATPAIKPLGVGINLLPHAGRELVKLGLRDALARAGIEAKERLFFTHHGQLVFREASGVFAGHEWPHFSIHRGDLQMVLFEAAKERIGAANIICDHRCVSIEQDDEGATIRFVGGNGEALAPVRADVVIACDGIHSSVRKQFYPDEGEPLFHGINMWRGVTRAKPFLTGASAIRVGGLYTTGKLVIYPIRDNIDGVGTQLINWVAEIVTDTHGPVDWSKPGNLADFYDIFRDWTFDWLDAAALLRNAEFILSFPMVDRDPIKRWTFGRVTLLGDAAHPMYPRGGNGGAQSILDAVALAKLLAAEPNVVGALKAYETLRLPLTSRIVLENRTRPPDIIIDTVERRTNMQRFDNLDSIISQDELREMSESYQKIAGYDRASVAQN